MEQDARPPLPVSHRRQIGYGEPGSGGALRKARSDRRGGTDEPSPGAAHRLADGETCGSAATPTVH
jgi:hypothetical protein